MATRMKDLLARFTSRDDQEDNQVEDEGEPAENKDVEKVPDEMTAVTSGTNIAKCCSSSEPDLKIESSRTLRGAVSSPSLNLLTLNPPWSPVIPQQQFLRRHLKWASVDDVISVVRRDRFTFGYGRRHETVDTFQYTALGRFASVAKLSINIHRLADQPFQRRAMKSLTSSDYSWCEGQALSSHSHPQTENPASTSKVEKKWDMSRGGFAKVYSMMTPCSDENLSGVESQDGSLKAVRNYPEPLSPDESDSVLPTSTDDGEAMKWKIHVTSSRRKDDVIKDLRTRLFDTQESLKAREGRIEGLIVERGEAVNRLLMDREHRIEQLERKLKEARKENSELRSSWLEACNGVHELRINNAEMMTSQMHMSNKIKVLEDTLSELRGDMAARQLAQQELNLRMFRKGQASAMFERQIRLEVLAKENPQNVMVSELLDKLQDTEKKLVTWQNMCTTESYDSGPRASAEPEVILSFLRDALYHYLTDRHNAKLHLRIMIEVLSYSEKQMQEILHTVCERQYKVVHSLACPCWVNSGKLRGQFD